MSNVLLWKRGFIWAEKSVFYFKKGVHFGLKSQCFISKRGRFELKSQCFATKKGDIFKLENEDGYHFFSEWGSQEYSILSLFFFCIQDPMLMLMYKDYITGRLYCKPAIWRHLLVCKSWLHQRLGVRWPFVMRFICGKAIHSYVGQKLLFRLFSIFVKKTTTLHPSCWGKRFVLCLNLNWYI